MLIRLLNDDEETIMEVSLGDGAVDTVVNTIAGLAKGTLKGAPETGYREASE